MKAIAYVRKSADIQDYEYQINAVTEECNKKNLELIQIFHETGSRKIRERPELMVMEQFIINSNDIDFVVVSELSRLGANSKTIELLELLNRKKIGLVLLKEQIETLNPDKSVNASSFLLLSIINGINTFELSTLSYRVKAGFKQSVIENRTTGGLNTAYGYRVEGTKKTSKIVRDSKEAETVKNIFNKYNSGVGISDIVRYLNESETPTRHKKIVNENPDKEYKSLLEWQKQSVYSILNNSIYTGKRKHTTGKKDGTKTKNIYEYFDTPSLRIITDEDFTSAENRLRNNTNKTGKHQKHTYLLEAKKVKCGCCEHYYIKLKNRYYCSSTRFTTKSSNQNISCGNSGVAIEQLDRLVQSVIFSNYSDILLNSLSNDSIKQKRQDLNNLLESYKKELDKVLKMEYNLIERMDRLTPEVFDLRLKDIQDMQKKVRKSIEQTEKQLKENKEEFENLTNIKKLEKNFNKKNESLPSSVINSIVNSITINKIENTSSEIQNIAKQVYRKYDGFDASLPSQDRVILITINAGTSTLNYLMSQRTPYIFDVQTSQLRINANEGIKLGFNDWYYQIKIN